MVVICMPLACEMLCWFSCFPVAMFHTLFFRSAQSLNVSTDQSDLLHREPATELCAAVPGNPGYISAQLVWPGRWGQWRSQNKLFRNWGFQKHSAVLSKPVQTSTETSDAVVLCYTWWKTVLNILGGPHCSGTALCHVGNIALFNAGGKVSDGCWWGGLWMCLLHFRNKKSHWPPVAVLETLLIY